MARRRAVLVGPLRARGGRGRRRALAGRGLRVVEEPRGRWCGPRASWWPWAWRSSSASATPAAFGLAVAALRVRVVVGPPAWPPPRACARRRDLVAHDLLGQLRDQLLQEAGHPLLLATELPGELGGVAVIQAVGELLDREVVRDLLELVEQLRLGVLEQLLGFARAADRVQRTLGERDALLGGGGHLRRGLGGDIRPGEVDGLGLAAELLDPPLQPLCLGGGLLEMLTQPLLVGIARRHRDVRLQRRLELLLLAVRLVEILDQLGFTGGRLRGHGGVCSSSMTIGLPLRSSRAGNRLHCFRSVVGVAQLVELLVVVQAVAGSSPVAHPR